MPPWHGGGRGSIPRGSTELVGKLTFIQKGHQGLFVYSSVDFCTVFVSYPQNYPQS